MDGSSSRGPPRCATSRQGATSRPGRSAYALNQEAELRRVLDDGDIPLDNTRAERALQDRRRPQELALLRHRHPRRGRRLPLQPHRHLPPARPRPVRLPRRGPARPPSWPRERYLELAPQRAGRRPAPGSIRPSSSAPWPHRRPALAPAPAVAASDPPPPAVPLGR
ncbi:MAG: transposase [Kofleriaceae bacterium]|nr:transposase [Kofleriaceae bacterium]